MKQASASTSETRCLWRSLPTSGARRNEQIAEVIANEIVGILDDSPLPWAVTLGCFLRDDLLHPFRYAMNSHDMALGFLHEEPPEYVQVFSEMRDGFVWDPPAPPPDLFNAACAEAARSCGFTPTSVSPPEICRFRGENIDSKINGEYSNRVSLGLPADRLLFLEWYDQREAAGLLARENIPERSILVAASTEGRANPFFHTYARRYLPFARKDGMDSLRVEVSERCARMERILLASHPVWSGDARRIMISTIKHRLEAMVNAHAFGTWIARAAQPRYALFGNDLQGSRRALAEGLRDAGVPLVVINHSGVIHERWRDLYRRKKGPVLVWGRREAALVDPEDLPGGVAAPVGCMRADIDALRSAPVETPPDEFKTRVVCLTNLIYHPMLVLGDHAAYEAQCTALAELARRRTDIDWVIKPHPRYDHHAQYENAVALSGGALTLERRPLKDALAGATVVVSFGAPTTAVLEALIGRRPLLIFESALFPEWRGALATCGRTVSDSAELETAIDAMCGDPALREQLIQKGQTGLAEWISAFGDEAAGNAARVLESVARPAQLPHEANGDAWLLRVVVDLTAVLDGTLAADAWRVAARSHARRGSARLQWSGAVNPINVGWSLCRYVIHEASPRQRVSTRSLVWSIRRLLPRGTRLGPGLLRVYLLLADQVDRAQGRTSPWTSRCLRLLDPRRRVKLPVGVEI
ncbi:MAG TPA: hypothetical protein PKE12_00535 [Kiritimatiellia bacterium]|nr:hypothetical protein [Kiritimatiellia bacterium]